MKSTYYFINNYITEQLNVEHLKVYGLKLFLIV